jgi:hypothetical protein
MLLEALSQRHKQLHSCPPCFAGDHVHILVTKLADVSIPDEEKGKGNLRRQ